MSNLPVPFFSTSPVLSFVLLPLAIGCGGSGNDLDTTGNVQRSHDASKPDASHDRDANGGTTGDESSLPEAAVHSDRRVATDADPEASAADAPEPRDAGRAAVDARIERADATSIRDAVASAESGPRRCDTMDVWYADGDGDGYGDPAEAYVGCSEPSTSNWVRSNEDCNDDDPRVHPGQRDYFGAPFSHAGEASFDYDCSGAEEADPLQAAAPHECGLLSIALCEGSGYLPTGRTATRVHELCGSTRLAVCQPSLGGLLFCESVVQHTTEPFRCR